MYVQAPGVNRRVFESGCQRLDELAGGEPVLAAVVLATRARYYFTHGDRSTFLHLMGSSSAGFASLPPPLAASLALLRLLWAQEVGDGAAADLCMRFLAGQQSTETRVPLTGKAHVSFCSPHLHREVARLACSIHALRTRKGLAAARETVGAVAEPPAPALALEARLAASVRLHFLVVDGCEAIYRAQLAHAQAVRSGPLRTLTLVL